MTAPVVPRRLRQRIPVGLTAAALVLSGALVAPAAAAEAVCEHELIGEPGPAAPPPVRTERLERALQQVRSLPRVGVSLLAQTTWQPDGKRAGALNCGVRSQWQVASASTVKPILVAELLDQRLDAGRRLSRLERRLARASILWSDNAAASSIWRRTGGHRGLTRYAREAGLRLAAGYGTKWGTTLVSAQTLTTFASLLLNPVGAIRPGAARFIRAAMQDVVPSQRWGITAGAPSRAVIAIKIGWLWTPYEGYRAHSFGIIETPRATYALAVVSKGSPGAAQAKARVRRAARLVNRAMRATDTALPRPTPTPTPTPTPPTPTGTPTPTNTTLTPTAVPGEVSRQNLEPGSSGDATSAPRESLPKASAAPPPG